MKLGILEHEANQQAMILRYQEPTRREGRYKVRQER